MIARNRSKMAPAPLCHVCGEGQLDAVPGYEALRRVTSDCKPWPSGGWLFACRSCGCIQKEMDDTWRDEAEAILRDYAIYHQGGGAEQAVFEERSGKASPRSARLLQRLFSRVELGESGRLLDIGCGNGALLRSFGGLKPSWSMAGTELGDKYREEVEALPGVEAFYTCAPSDIPGVFDLITMVHVLEHIREPGEFLAKLCGKLRPGGLMVVHVPDYLQNPFDLLIADHCSHFGTGSAVRLVQESGYQVAAVARDWVPKELTIAAQRAELSREQGEPAAGTRSLELATKTVGWLESVVETAREISRNASFGIFGTSIAGTWLCSELEDSVSFFVDEDPNRVSRNYMGRPVCSLSEAPRGSNVFLALPTRLAEAVRNRLGNTGIEFHLPPVLPADQLDIEELARPAV